jgi:cell division septal protein FtsQ
MSKPVRKSAPPAKKAKPAAKAKPRFPWLLLLVLLATVYLFWILPHQLGPRPVQVEFGEPDAPLATP